MLEPNFVLPDKNISKKETDKRIELIDWFKEYIKDSVIGLIVSGSMSYGQNHSVKSSSDIDMQLLVNPRTVKKLIDKNCFEREELKHAVDGYLLGLYQQFSLVFKKDNVSMECHFWDEQAFCEAVTYKSQSTKRLRSSIETPSTDYGYSFDRDESVQDYYGEIVDDYAVSDFPSYRLINGKIYLCRPITNILGLPLIIIENERLNKAINDCWKISVSRLVKSVNGNVDLNKYNIANTLPGKNKMSPESLKNVQLKTKQELKAQSS